MSMEFLNRRLAMRVSRKEAEANRERVVEVASALYRKHGFDGVGVADIMKKAGLTHGGFYGHFRSEGDFGAGGFTWAPRGSLGLLDHGPEKSGFGAGLEKHLPRGQPERRAPCFFLAPPGF